MLCHLPCSQSCPTKPNLHMQRYPLSVKPVWQVPPFLQGSFTQELCIRQNKQNSKPLYQQNVIKRRISWYNQDNSEATIFEYRWNKFNWNLVGFLAHSITLAQLAVSLEKPCIGWSRIAKCIQLQRRETIKQSGRRWIQVSFLQFTETNPTFNYSSGVG